MSEISRRGHEALVGKNTNFHRCCNWETAQVGHFLSPLLSKVNTSLRRSQKKSQTEADEQEITSWELWLQAIRLWLLLITILTTDEIVFLPLVYEKNRLNKGL